MAHDDEAPLDDGDVRLVARMPWSSNATFLVEIGDTATRAVYKPARGERPLWDFPRGLYRRELAAYLLSEQLGWDLVPDTIVREDAPLGVGSLQRFVPHDPDRHYAVLLDEAHDEVLAQLRRLCVFDLVANQADRKSGHCVVDAEGRVRALDNGLCLHHEDKLRTVIWDFAGEEIDAALLIDVARLAEEGPADDLAALLDAFERDALVSRAAAVARSGRLPFDETGRRWPWPLV